MLPYATGRDWALGYFTSPFSKKNDPKFIISLLSCPCFWGAEVLVCFPCWSPQCFPHPSNPPVALGCNHGWCESQGEKKALSWQHAWQQLCCKTAVSVAYCNILSVKSVSCSQGGFALTKNKARLTTPVRIPRSQAGNL